MIRSHQAVGPGRPGFGKILYQRHKLSEILRNRPNHPKWPDVERLIESEHLTLTHEGLHLGASPTELCHLDDVGVGKYGRVKGAVGLDTQTHKPRSLCVKALPEGDGVKHLSEVLNTFQVQDNGGEEFVTPIFEATLAPDGSATMVMDRGGVSLQSRLWQRETGEFSNVVDLLEKLTNCIAFCWRQGISHEDIHAGNILISRGLDNQISVKLCDFGESRPLESINHSRPPRDFRGISYFVNSLLLSERGYSSPEERQLLEDFMDFVILEPSLYGGSEACLELIQGELRRLKKKCEE